MKHHGYESSDGMKTPYTDGMMVEVPADFSVNMCQACRHFCDILTPHDIQTSKTWCHRCAMAGWENHSMGDSPAKYV